MSQTSLFNDEIDRKVGMRDLILVNAIVTSNIAIFVKYRNIDTGFSSVGIRSITARSGRIPFNREFNHEFLSGAIILVTPTYPVPIIRSNPLVISFTVIESDDRQLSINHRNTNLTILQILKIRAVEQGILISYDNRSKILAIPKFGSRLIDGTGIHRNIRDIKIRRDLKTVGDTVHNLRLTRNRALRTTGSLRNGLEDA